MVRVRRLLISGAISAALWLLLLAGLALANPANATLDVIPDPTAADVGDRITVTVELVNMDAEETFVAWAVRLRYNTTTLEVATYTIHADFWQGGSSLPVFLENPNDLYFGDSCGLSCDSGTNTPFLLATIVFTVTGDGYTNFEVVTTTIDNYTSLTYPDWSFWQPRQINTSQAVLPVAIASIATHTGTKPWGILLALGLAAAVPLGAWGKAVYQHRHPRPNP